MKKILSALFIMIISAGLACGSDFVIDEVQLRPAKSISLPKGTLIKIHNIKELSSILLDEGDSVSMIAPTDVYVGETNLIPRNTVFYGTIEKLREPVQGTNAAIIIKMNKMVTPEGLTYEINGYVSADGSNTTLGGERTPPLYYAKMPHYTNWKLTKWRVGAAQYCETNTRQFGAHTIIKPGAELFLILQDNFVLVQ